METVQWLISSTFALQYFSFVGLKQKSCE